MTDVSRGAGAGWPAPDPHVPPPPPFRPPSPPSSPPSRPPGSAPAHQGPSQPSPWATSSDGGWQPPRLAEPRPPHPTLPLAAGVGAVIVLAASLVASKFILELIVDFRWPIVVYVVLLSLMGYGPSVWWVRYATNRWGSGSWIDDVGARPRWSDLGWGPVTWLTAIGCQLVVAAFVLGFDIPLSNNTDGISELSADRAYVIAIVITAVVVAPLVEEVVFRGLVMRSLLSVMHPVVAIGLQAVLFGVAHVDPVRGVGNIGLALVLSGVGVALGGAAYLLRRIGPSVVAHAILNGVVMILVLTGVSDQLQEDNPDLVGIVVVAETDES